MGVHHVVGLTKSGSGKCRLAGEALQAVAFRYAMITVAVGVWVEFGRSDGLTGGCGRTDVVGIDGGGLFDSALVAVVVVSVVQCPGGAVMAVRSGRGSVAIHGTIVRVGVSEHPGPANSR